MSKIFSKNLLFCVLFALFFIPTFAQNSAENMQNLFIPNNKSLSYDEYIESVSREEDELEDLLAIIHYFENNKIILSKSNVEQIAELPTITYFEAYNIHDVVHRDTNVTMDNLCKILNLNEYKKFVLLHCALINTPKNLLSNLNAKITERTAYQLETPIGYENGKYIGQQWRLLQKYQANYKTPFAKYGAGATINKNAGEQYLNEFMSGYFVFDNIYAKIIAGDFEIRVGMGNIYGDSYSQGMGINTISPTINYANKISPYTSKMDYRLMRGVTTRLDIPITSETKITSTLWYSNAPRSATFSKDSSYISSIYTTGYYRTLTEISKKNNFDELNLGATIEFNGCNYNIGGLLTYLDFGKEIRSTAARAFVGENGFMSSLFASFYFDKIDFCTEISFDNHSKVGLKLGTAYKSKTLDIAFQVRSFDEDFRSPYGSMFGEFSYPANELGLYSGIVWKPEAKYRLSSFFDWFYSYAPTSTVDTNVTGFHIFTQFDYVFKKELSFYARLDYKSKTNQTKVNNKNIIYQRDKIKFRFFEEYYFTKSFSIRTKADLVYLLNENIIDDELGVAFALEGKIKVNDWLSLKASSTIFSTASFQSTIWQFEYYYPGYSLSTSIYGDGVRSFLAAQFKISKYLDIHLRYINMYKPDVTSIGSSYELINSNQQNRIYCQFEFKF
jgi:hypothetical protein